MSATKKQTVSKTSRSVKAKTAARRKAGKTAKANSRSKAGKAKAAVKQGYGGVGYRVLSGGKGYKGHRIGSRKERVHKAYDRSGVRAAEQCARRAGIKKVTLKAWLYAFGHLGEDGGDEE